MVVNYKQLNNNTILYGYFLPNKETLIHKTKGKKLHLKFDCKSGFYQIKMAEDSKPLIAFSTPQGHYEWNVLPFRLKNTPQLVTPQILGVFFFFFHCPSLSRQNFLVVHPRHVVCVWPGLSRAPSLVCRARLAWYVTRAWPALSRHNTMPHYRARQPSHSQHYRVR